MAAETMMRATNVQWKDPGLYLDRVRKPSKLEVENHGISIYLPASSHMLASGRAGLYRLCKYWGSNHSLNSSTLRELCVNCSTCTQALETQAEIPLDEE